MSLINLKSSLIKIWLHVKPKAKMCSSTIRKSQILQKCRKKNQKRIPNPRMEAINSKAVSCWNLNLAIELSLTFNSSKNWSRTPSKTLHLRANRRKKSRKRMWISNMTTTWRISKQWRPSFYNSKCKLKMTAPKVINCILSRPHTAKNWLIKFTTSSR